MEKREHTRIDNSLNVWYQTFDEDDISFGRIKSENISIGGILLIMSDFEDVGINVILKFKIPGYDEKILTRGKIVWVKKSDSQNYKLGVRFHTIRDKDKQAIKKLTLQ